MHASSSIKQSPTHNIETNIINQSIRRWKLTMLLLLLSPAPEEKNEPGVLLLSIGVSSASKLLVETAPRAMTSSTVPHADFNTSTASLDVEPDLSKSSELMERI